MWQFVDCESVNTHFWRNFITNNDDEDVQLEINGDPLSYKIVGFQRYHNNLDFSSPRGNYRWGNVRVITPVSQAFQYKYQGIDQDSGDSELDGATYLVPMAATIAALCTTLLF